MPMKRLFPVILTILLAITSFSSSNAQGRWSFTSTRRITEQDLRGLSDWDLTIMRNEIYARHGYIFQTKQMKEYFNSQSWYYPRYSSVNLSNLEYQNVATIKNEEDFRKNNPYASRSSRSSNYAGIWPFTSERALTESDLYGLSAWDLKIMRNEIYARHGYIFKTTEMRNYFTRQSWYVPMYESVTLTPLENGNVAFILKHEK